MKRSTTLAALIVPFSIAGHALAGERTVTLAVDNISCVPYAYEARATIAAVPGVSDVKFLLASRTAVVTFDDAQTTPDAIAAASAEAGYPARLAGAGE